MAIKRVDFYKDENGKFRYYLPNKGFYIKKEHNSTETTLLSRNWNVYIRESGIEFHCQSLARGPMDDSLCRTFNREYIEGSLFLVTTNNNWYWYWRDKEVQDILDKYDINKLVPVYTKHPVELEQVVLAKLQYDQEGQFLGYDVAESPIKGSESFSVYMHNTASLLDITPDIIIRHDSFEDNECLILSKARFIVSDFLLVKNRNAHKTLYINSNFSITDVDTILASEPIEYNMIRPVLDEAFLTKTNIINNPVE